MRRWNELGLTVNNIDRLSDDEFIGIVEVSRNYTDLVDRAGYKSRNLNAVIRAKERIEELKIDGSHLDKSVRRSGRYKYSLDELLVENSIVRSSDIKSRIIKDGLLRYECYICGLGPEWNGESLTLELDHINGNNRDNRIENLRILCPNCHTQTDTCKGKQNKRNYGRSKICSCGGPKSAVAAMCIKCRYKKNSSKRPNEKEFFDDFNSLGTYGCAKKYSSCLQKVYDWRDYFIKNGELEWQS